jgi:hypothetical protein
MKNKHLVLLFLSVLTAAWCWNRYFRSESSNQSADKKLAAEFLEKYESADRILFDDGTEPQIELSHDIQGWRLGFGALSTAADEDTLKSFMQAVKSLAYCATTPTSSSNLNCTISTAQASYLLRLHQGDTLSLQKLGSEMRASFTGKLGHFFRKPYDQWLFRKLQVKAAEQITSLTYQWKSFEPMHLQKVDTTWQIAAAKAINHRFLQDSLLPSLNQLNQLEPALDFDPISDAIPPFCTLAINDGNAATLTCYRMTEQGSAYFLKSSNVENLCFKLPISLANLLFCSAYFSSETNSN